MIRSHVGHRHPTEWFLVDNDEISSLVIAEAANGQRAYVPGVSVFNLKQGIYQVHRSHLPLIGGFQAAKLVNETPRYDWVLRDAKLADRQIKLRVTQHQAIDYIDPRRGTLLGDDMRLGKTLTSLMSHDPVRGPLVVVAPKSARAVWLGWMRRLWPEIPIGIAIGKQLSKEIISKPLVFLHYEIAAQWQALFPIGTLVLDEAHYLTNKDSKRSKACVLLASRAAKVIATTGTPIYTRPIDLWNVLGTICPGAWADAYSFGYRYCGPEETEYGTRFEGISHNAELKDRLSQVMIRRLWKDCRNDLPPISRSIIVAEVDDRTRRKLDVLAAKLRTERTNTAGTMAHYRRQICSLKLPAVVNEIERIHKAGEPQVVWTWHKDNAEDLAIAIALRLAAPVYKIHGDIDSDKRDKTIEQWRGSPDGVLIATMAVGQIAIDLSHASIATYAELDYTPLVIGQSEMRTFDASRPMRINFVVADHVVDQRMIRSLISKLGSSDPLGLGSANDAIAAIREAVDGPADEPDMQRFLDDLFESGIE